jgi:hypothetical protein
MGGGGGEESPSTCPQRHCVALPLALVGGKKFEKLGGKISECPDSGTIVTLLEFLLSQSDITSAEV